MIRALENDLYTGKRSIEFIGKRKLWFTIAILSVVIAFGSFIFKGFNLGIEFTGGSQFVVSNTHNQGERPAFEVIKEHGISELPRVTKVGAEGIRIQTVNLSQDKVHEVRESLAKSYNTTTEDITSTSIGATWGGDVLNKAIKSLVIFLVIISIILTAYFRTWTMSVAAIISLFHDLIVTFGIYNLVGFEVTPATVIGLLTILGYSLYDTVVVFDQMRENSRDILAQTRLTYEEGANLSANQTLARSISTSVTGLLPVAGVLFIGTALMGAGTLQDIALAIFVGMIVATLSSVFLATPLAVELRARRADIREHTALVKQIRTESGHTVSGHAAVVEALADSGEDYLVAGGHKGNRAQPKKKKRSNRK